MWCVCVCVCAADRPSAPNSPTVLPVRDGSYMVSWTTPSDGGSPILFYNLLVNPLQLHADQENWTLVYNGSETQWVVDGLDIGQSYVFRVAAVNVVAWSEYSLNSTIFVMDVPGSVIIVIIVIIAQLPYAVHSCNL